MKPLLALFIAICNVGLALAQTLEETNERVVRSEAPIVAGNAVSAKKRALAEAFRQATERAFTELITQNGVVNETPRLQQLKSSFASIGQKYIRRYRILEEGEAQGQLLLMVEAEVDTVLLRREIEKLTDNQAGSAGGQSTLQGAPLLIAGKVGSSFVNQLIKGLAVANVKTVAHSAKDERALLVVAAKASSPALYLKVESTNEGKIRGSSQLSVACRVNYRLFTSIGLKHSATESGRGFAIDESEARESCLDRLVPQIVHGVSQSFQSTLTRSPFITLNLDVVEPAVLSYITAALKRLGAVTASEVRLVTLSQVEIRVFTRVVAATLQTLLLRELSSKLTITPVRLEPDRLTLQIRIPPHTELVTPQGNTP